MRETDSRCQSAAKFRMEELQGASPVCPRLTRATHVQHIVTMAKRAKSDGAIHSAFRRRHALVDDERDFFDTDWNRLRAWTSST
jgi:hypothetical protein